MRYFTRSPRWCLRLVPMVLVAASLHGAWEVAWLRWVALAQSEGDSAEFGGAPVAGTAKRVEVEEGTTDAKPGQEPPAEKTPKPGEKQEAGPAPGPAEGQESGKPGEPGAPGEKQEATQDAQPVAEKKEEPEKPKSSYLPKKDIEIELSLRNALRIALERNLDIRLATADFTLTYHDLLIQKSIFDPFFTLGANYGKYRRPTASFLDIGGGGLLALVQVNPFETSDYSVGLRGLTPVGTTYTLSLRQGSFDRPLASGSLFGINPQVESSASVRVTQPLLKGAWYPYNVAQIRIASNTRQLTRRQLMQTAIDTIFQAEQAYWELVFALKNFESKLRALEVALQDVENARKRRDVGTLAPIDVTITESQAALRKVEFNEAELLLEDSRDRLLELLNRSGRRSLKSRWESGEKQGPFDRLLVIPTTAPDTEPFVPDREEALKLAFEERPDYHQVDLELKNQDLRVDVARNELLPQLDLIASWEQYGLSDDLADSFSSFGGGDFYGWSVGVQLEVPIPNRGPKHNYRRAQEELLRIQLRRTQLENRIFLEVDQSIRKLKSLSRKVGDLEERVRLQEAILDAERKKLRVGKSISYTVSTIENDLVDSQAQALRAKADYQSARAEYYKATGILLKKHEFEIAP